MWNKKKWSNVLFAICTSILECFSHIPPCMPLRKAHTGMTANLEVQCLSRAPDTFCWGDRSLAEGPNDNVTNLLNRWPVTVQSQRLHPLSHTYCSSKNLSLTLKWFEHTTFWFGVRHRWPIRSLKAQLYCNNTTHESKVICGFRIWM